jgi:hypothetical protein
MVEAGDVENGQGRAALSKQREEEIRADITARLRGVCGEWSEEEFKAVVEKIVRTTAKYFYTEAEKVPR